MNESASMLPSEIVNYMLKNDPFSRWMGIEILEVDEGFCKIGCSVNDEMLNGFSVTHGGIIFALADSALAFASATFGRVSLAIDNSISFTKKTTTGDRLIATSTCINLTHKTGIFDIKVSNEKDQLIAVMKGTVYRTDEKFSF